MTALAYAIDTAPAVAPDRLFVIEDDPLFARALQRVALAQGVYLDVFHPDTDFFQLPQDGDYDAAIIDCDLGEMSGAQVAALYRTTHVLLVSRSAAMASAVGPWPRSVRGFKAKSEGAAKLIAAGIALACASRFERDY